MPKKKEEPKKPDPKEKKPPQPEGVSVEDLDMDFLKKLGEGQR